MARTLFLVLFTLSSYPVWAVCGRVDYSWGAQSLFTMIEYIVIAMVSVRVLLSAIGGALGLYGAFIVYFKSSQEQSGAILAKGVSTLVAGVLILIFAFAIMPAMFGFSMIDGTYR